MPVDSRPLNGKLGWLSWDSIVESKYWIIFTYDIWKSRIMLTWIPTWFCYHQVWHHAKWIGLSSINAIKFISSFLCTVLVNCLLIKKSIGIDMLNTLGSLSIKSEDNDSLDWYALCISLETISSFLHYFQELSKVKVKAAAAIKSTEEKAENNLREELQRKVQLEQQTMCRWLLCFFFKY